MGKKEKTTKLISVMVSATLATGMVPAAAFAQEAVEAGSLNEDTPSLLSGDEISPWSEGDVAASGTCGATSEDNLTWTLTQNNNGEDAPTYTLSI